MRLFHLLQSHDSSKPTGVPRFSSYFQMAFPDVINIVPSQIGGIEWREDDVVVTDNHYSLMVPERVKTIVVHHGNAVYHYEVDESWRNSMTQQIATGQRLMFHKRNRLYVAPSKWIQDRFRDFAPSWYDSLSVVLPHWVPQIHGGEKALRNVRPRVIGDWRNPNKGSEVWRVSQNLSSVNYTASTATTSTRSAKTFTGAPISISACRCPKALRFLLPTPRQPGFALLPRKSETVTSSIRGSLTTEMTRTKSWPRFSTPPVMKEIKSRFTKNSRCRSGAICGLPSSKEFKTSDF
jgi:hypothetical protein